MSHIRGHDGVAAADGALHDGHINDVVVAGLARQHAHVLGQFGLTPPVRSVRFISLSKYLQKRVYVQVKGDLRRRLVLDSQ
jgi:hypothetical protein